MEGNQTKQTKNQGQNQLSDLHNSLFLQVNENRYELPPQPTQHENIEQKSNNNDFPRVSSSSSLSRSEQSKSKVSNQQSWEYESMKQIEQQKKNQDQKVIPTQKGPERALDRVIRYKYCCKKCKHADRDKDKKACVCVVPRDQRRTHLGNQGCQTCGCNGCSKEDFIYKGEDPEYHPDEKRKQSKIKQPSENFQARNGCCKNCMKAFSKSGKSCICQVPEDVRKTKLSSAGCKICGCVGCNPEDRKTHKSQRRTRRSRSRSQKRKSKKKSRSKDKKKRSKSRSPEIIDTFAMNFHNIDRSIVGSMIINEYQIDPALLGFGIPQRSTSYLLGKNRQK